MHILNLNLFKFKFKLMEVLSSIPLIQFNWIFCIGSLMSYTLCPHHLSTMFKYFLIYLNLNLIQTSTSYNSCCSIPFRMILFAYWIIWNILPTLSTHLSYWHDIHLEFIMPLVIIFYINNSFSVTHSSYLPPITFEHIDTCTVSIPVVIVAKLCCVWFVDLWFFILAWWLIWVLLLR